jgi:peptide/nickel transport system permease protein
LLKFFSKQVLRFALTLLAVGLVANTLIEFIPGDPAAVAAGEFATPERIEIVRQEMRLDEPLLVRYASWLGDAVRGDLAESQLVKPGEGVVGLIIGRLGVTLIVAGLALAIAISVAVPLGALAAVRRGTRFDRIVRLLTSTSLAIPSFVMGLLLVAFLAIETSLFPATGWVGPREDFLKFLHHAVLPCIALAVIPAAEITRQVRGALIDTFEKPFIRTARATGNSRRAILWKHAGKAAAPPVLTVIGLQSAALIGGAVVIEQIFVVPGLGTLVISAVSIRDIAVVQGAVVIGATLVLTVNLLVDLLQTYLQPKAR